MSDLNIMVIPTENNNIQPLQSPKVSTTWKSCCMVIDRGATRYFIQVSILGGMITTSMVMLIYDNDCSSQRWWSGLLTLCLGVFLPAPKLI